MSLEIVRWRDAHYYKDLPDSVPKDYVVKTVGWVSEDKRFLRIVSERCPDAPRCITYVPLEGVVSRTKLRREA